MTKRLIYVCDSCKIEVISRTKPKGWHSKRGEKTGKYQMLCVACLTARGETTK